jgi:hypothetical protein
VNGAKAPDDAPPLRKDENILKDFFVIFCDALTATLLYMY